MFDFKQNLLVSCWLFVYQSARLFVALAGMYCSGSLVWLNQDACGLMGPTQLPTMTVWLILSKQASYENREARQIDGEHIDVFTAIVVVVVAYSSSLLMVNQMMFPQASRRATRFQ